MVASGNWTEPDIYTISASYLLYETSYAVYDFVESTTYLLNSNNIYSNIRGGTGIMAGYTLNKVFLK